MNTNIKLIFSDKCPFTLISTSFFAFVTLVLTILSFLLFKGITLRDFNHGDCYIYVKENTSTDINKTDITHILNAGHQIFRYYCSNYKDIVANENSLPVDDKAVASRSKNRSRSKVQSVNKTKNLVALNLSDIKVPSVFIHVDGGLGNQIFQYACSYTIAKKNDWPLYVHVPSFILQGKDHRRFRPQQREFVLDQFEIPLYNMTVNPDIGTYAINISKQVKDVWDSDILLGNYSVILFF